MNQDDSSEVSQGNSDRHHDKSARSGVTSQLNRTELGANASRTLMDISQISSTNLAKN